MEQLQTLEKPLHQHFIPETSPLHARSSIVEFQNRVRIREMIEAGVARTFDVTGSELRMASRGRKKVAFARQVAMYLAHVCCGLTLTEVGVVFSRDRTTVAYACTVVEDHRDDETFDYILELLERVALSNIRPRNIHHVGRSEARSA